jgi:hypothetical protein
MKKTIVRSYRAALNLDYTGQKTNEYQKLIAALLQLGWKYVETSAYTLETSDLNLVWRGIDLITRQSAVSGSLSALTLHIQGSRNFNGIKFAAANSHPKALEQISKKELPWE